MTTITAGAANHSTVANAPNSLSERIIAMVCWLNTAFAVYAERRDMLKLTDQELSDIGITRQQVKEESKRSFFDVPAR